MSNKSKASHIEEKEDNIENEVQDQNAQNTNAEVEKLNSDLEEQKEKYLRLMAEFENYKRRTHIEKIETIQTAGKEVIKALLPILDDLERSEKLTSEATDLEKVIEGDKLIFNKLRTVLEQKGLKPMEVLNTPFDVDTQEAITQIDAGEELHGKVVDELEKGYYLNDKILRFAKVVVGS
ncbi:MAG: nucleotide exchange factor GrpE [Ferruginibacter sp.]